MDAYLVPDAQIVASFSGDDVVAQDREQEMSPSTSTAPGTKQALQHNSKAWKESGMETPGSERDAQTAGDPAALVQPSDSTRAEQLTCAATTSAGESKAVEASLITPPAPKILSTDPVQPHSGPSITTLPLNYPPVANTDVGNLVSNPTKSTPTIDDAAVSNVDAADALMDVNSAQPEDLTTEHMEGEKEDEDEEVLSELSDGEDLRDDLLDALGDDNFSFQGSFYHARLLTTAPNPCIHISGLGLVGLPLSERDAKLIVSCATLAPFGHGERTVVDKDVRHTWEIEPSKVAFAYKEWETYVNGSVCTEVCKQLGVALGNSPPRMEFYKLLLYETGSHFLPHQDTQKANGMFATVIILLPSAYTGGQVIVSHSSKTRTLDFAPNSLFSTALLAWYTDVKHEVKRVTSGYRLALSYNLIHTAPPEVPQPCLPDMSDAVYVLRRVLRKWKNAIYQEMPKGRLIAYLLNHEYSSANLQEGLKALKGSDAHRVTFLRDIAEELGFIVGLASLKHNVCGSADDDGANYYSRSRRDDYYSGDDSDRESTPSMMEVGHTSTTISGLVDLNGSSLLPVGKIELGDDALIPKDPFEDQRPDATEYEGYMGNGAGQLDYWYRRTALILMHTSDVDDISFSVAGLPYAFGKLKKSTTTPTQEDQLWAGRILDKISSLNKEQTLTMFDCALKWKDADMCKSVMKCHACTLATVDVSRLVKACKVFSFGLVRVSFEEILARSKEIHRRINFIYNLRPQAPAKEKSAVAAWCKKELDKVLRSYTTADPKDIPTIMTIIRVSGLGAFVDVIMPNLVAKQDFYPFWIAMIKALRDGKTAILERILKKKATTTSGATSLLPTMPSGPPSEAGPPDPAAQPAEASPSDGAVDKVIKACLHTALAQWCKGATQGPNRWGRCHSTTPVQTQVDRIIELLELALVDGDLDTCRKLFVDILESSASVFKQICNPLIPRLRTFLEARNIDMCTPPFLDIFQVVIGRYLRDVLGKKCPLFKGNLREIGCGCSVCSPFNQLMLNTESTRVDIRLTKTHRKHLEGRIAAASDLCTSVPIRMGRFDGVRVTKRPEVVEAGRWSARQNQAKFFLAQIGPDELIKNVMGPRYADVVSAINGTQAFTSVRTTITVPSATAGVTLATPKASSNQLSSIMGVPSASSQLTVASSSAHTASTASTATTVVPVQLAGKKRKSGPIILGPVIDLTGEDTD